MPILNKHDARKQAEPLLVSMARSGDRNAFEELVRRYQSWARNLMRRLSGNPALADDLAQQVFLTAYRKIGSIQSSAKFGGWLRQIAVTTWLQHIRKNDPLWHAAEEGEISEPVLTRDGALALDLDRALSTLAGPVRTCITLSYHERLTHAEIAEALDLPVGTVKSHIRRGTEKLKRILAPYRIEKETSYA